MLQLILGVNWRTNRDHILSCLAQDVRRQQDGLVLLVPEQSSHNYERLLCRAAGDTASRYGEVLSFTRLASRVFSITGGVAVQTLDGGGRLLAMAAAVQQLRPKLKAYAAAGGKPEFLSALVTAVDEFKSCCITPQDLKAAGGQCEGTLAQKAEELSLLLEGYDSVCAGFGQDPRDRMTKLLEQLELSDFPQTHRFYIDGFSDFTTQELKIISLLLETSPQVAITLNTDAIGSTTPGMELAGETGKVLLRLAAQHQTPHTLITLPDPEAALPLAQMRQCLLDGTAAPIARLPEAAHACRFSDIRKECAFAAARIRELAISGVRYRDISLVLSDPQRYTPVLRRELSRFKIPAYFAGTEDILHKSVIHTLLTALDAVTGGQDQGDVLRYLKSLLSPLTAEECDRLENYAIAWGIRKGGWSKPFHKHPNGLGQEWTPADRSALDALEQSRVRGIEPLMELQKALQSGETVLAQLQGVYEFLQRISLGKRLEALADRFAAEGDTRSAQQQEQLWDILMQAMEQMAALLGQFQLAPEVFVRLFKLLLSQYHVGTIPQVLDCVTAGGVTAMRRQEARYVFLLGAQEGFLPAGSSGGIVLTESERQSLVSLGVPLQTDLYRQLEQELSGIYAVAVSATKEITLTTGAGQCAHIYRRLCRMLDLDDAALTELSPEDAVSDPWDGAAAMLQSGATPPPFLAEAARFLQAHAGFSLGTLSPQTVQMLYGKELRLSASQVDKVASCQFAYFMRYGLKLQPRKELSVDPAEFGTFVHEILERTARKVKELGGFQQVSLEQTQELAMQYAEEYQKTRLADLEDLSQRQNYLFRRNMQELLAVVGELWVELSQSDFTPAGFEVQFGPGGDLPAIQIPGGAMPAYLRGFVDRMDIYRWGGGTYVRVVDYKTGRKDFDYCDILCGLGLQMLLYLFALEDGGEALLGEQPAPAGVLYFPARVPVEAMKAPADPQAVAAQRQKTLKRQGLILADGAVLGAMDHTQELRFLPIKAGKDGELTGDVASISQFHQLKAYLMELLKALVDQIAGGLVEPNPYFRGDHDACRFCDYAQSCHLDLWGKPRVYRKIDRNEFWAEIQKEGSKDGQ